MPPSVSMMGTVLPLSMARNPAISLMRVALNNM